MTNRFPQQFVSHDYNLYPDLHPRVRSVNPGVSQRRDIQGRPIKSPYTLGSEGKKTNMWLRIARGSSERLISMNIVSNSSCEERAWRHWKQQCEKDGVPLPTFLDIDMIMEQLKSAETCACYQPMKPAAFKTTTIK